MDGDGARREDGMAVARFVARERVGTRGLAAGDLDGDGLVEIVATTTQTARTEDGGSQVFVFAVNGAPTARGGPLRMGQPNR